MKKKGVLVKLMVLALAAYFAVTVVRLQIAISEKEDEEALCRQKIEELTLSNQKKADLRASGDYDDYIADIAREQGNGKPGEKIFITLRN